MKLLTHVNQINQQLPDSPLKTHIQARFDALAFESDVPPNLILVESGDDIAGPDYAFIGSSGLLSDLWDEHGPGHPNFSRPYEWVSHLPDLKLYEALYLEGYDLGYWILIPEDIVKAHLDLQLALTSQGLSDPQPLY